MIVLSALVPLSGVPDALSEALQWDASTDEEVLAGHVLRVHRDWLNGGLEQALSNLREIEEPIEPYIAAYQLIGLCEAADLVQEAAIGADGRDVTDAKWEGLDDRYSLLTYGEGGDQPDAIEKAVVQFAQSWPEQFRVSVEQANAVLAG